MDEIILETSEEVVDLRYGPSTNSAHVDVLAILPHSAVIINGETATATPILEGAKKYRGKIVDCVFLESSKSHAVAFDNSSIAIIQEGAAAAADTSDLSTCSLPSQPHRIYDLGSKKGLAILCEDASVWHLTLVNDVIPSGGVIPSAPKATEAKASKVLASCYHDSSLSIIKSEKDGKYVLLTWNVTTAPPEGTCMRIPESIAISTDIGGILDAGDHDVVDLLVQPNAKSLFVISKSSSSSGRILKIDSVDGTVLFVKDLSESPVRGLCAYNLLWIIGKSRVSLWDTRYGVEVNSFAHSLKKTHGLKFLVAGNYHPFASSSSVTAVANTSTGRNRAAAAAAAKSASAQILDTVSLFSVSVSGRGGGATILRKRINLPPLHSAGSLCGVIGKRAAATGGVIDKQKAESKAKRRKTSTSDLSEPQRLYQSELVSVTDGNGRVSVPIETTRDVVRSFSALAEGQVPAAEDWTALLTVLSTGAVSLAAIPAGLLQVAATEGRCDVLAKIAKFVPDLSERSAVKLLNLVAAVPENKLNYISLINGDLVWNPNGRVTAAAAGAGGGGSAAPPRSAKKPKQGKTGKSDSNNISEDGESTSAKSADGKKGGVFPDKTSHALVLIALVEALLKRNGAYSSILLAEALKFHFAPSTTPLLLRVLMIFSGGMRSTATTALGALAVAAVSLKRGKEKKSSSVSVPSTNSGVEIAVASYLGPVADFVVRNSVTWAEALLDAHFANIVMKASHDTDTQIALKNSLASVSVAMSAAEDVELALGLWAHTGRGSKSGSAQVVPSKSLYQFDRLKF